MDSDTLQVFQSELTCSICMNCFLDPITIDCGHSFCRPCLSLCWEEGQTPRSCPECRGIAERPDFKTNIVLKRLASLARQARADHDRRSEEQICETHQEARGLFCEAAQTLLCGPCSERPEHAAHSHSPIHRAAEESREKLLKTMSSLWKMREEIQISLNQEANTTQFFEIIIKMFDYVALRKVMIKLKYQRILRLLRDKEQLHLRALEKEAKEIYEQLKEIVFRMTQQRESLKEIDRELTEMCHMLDMELLQVRKEVNARTDVAQIQKPQPVNPELPSWPVAGFLNMLNNFRMNNVLSWTTTVHHVILDDASVLFEDDHPGGSRQPRGGACAVFWGGWAFTSGRQYWELDVSLSSSWVLGVCKSIFTRDTSISMVLKKHFFLCSTKVNSQYILSTTSPPFVQFVKRPLGKIGVFLDYDKGTVSFYDVFRSSLIYSSLPSAFSSPLIPFLCLKSP
ncbi:tripartite motif-containing protein 64-like [Cervus canadensis]|uniref:tripartite motif-containing protein 64-like n=1 Tax=Cervus canadensis TaxID=1574408 RepID=UPI001CA34919|nr:tripartite motif-containing protein 64-like [Cervus canadensis]